MSDNLMTQIRAAIDADEQIALAAMAALAEHTYAPQDVVEGAELARNWDVQPRLFHLAVIAGSIPGWNADVVDSTWRGLAIHIARHDPARVLRQVQAHKKLLKGHGGQHDCQSETARGDVSDGDCDVIRALADIYGIG
jgi:hypothetical protein